MEWVALAVLAVAVIVVTVLLATGRLNVEALAEPTSTTPPLELPPTVTSGDVDALSLGTTLYGYAPAEVDAALDARRDRLAEQDRALGERTSGERDDHVHPDA
ncbi:hypothetical protein JNB_07714 [Janibacter sp. HTCC2649]|uniref:hypothetical protein n=1 Tax=Janibacter sp. HTCC2649 TaxID=313589 RepID=UPI0000670D63|nr:hypothetical protein [Janibacter sp. HTCC2649]EAQ00040.1 hypothetical protein JNB_07714 [Janibacter sp. HTCC2649]